MTSTNRRSVLLIFYGLAATLFYCAGALLLYVFSGILLYNGVVVDFPIVAAYQENIYFGGFRTEWNCREYDEDLLYKPRPGECRFDNPEFRTIQNFDAQGRVSGHKTGGIGIAVLGDSHATGWGVDDDDTFAAILEEKAGRPVFNLAAPSYATYRELLSLEKSGLADRVDTVIIQYCENDLRENLQNELLKPTKEYYDSLFNRKRSGDEQAWLVVSHIRNALIVPFERAWMKLLLFLPRSNSIAVAAGGPDIRDFEIHYKGIDRVLEKFPALLKGKKVIVFYSNAHGQKFNNFAGATSAVRSDDVRFVDLDLTPNDYYILDDHPKKSGHEKIANKLFDLLNESRP
jgi:hypothetical protein